MPELNRKAKGDLAEMRVAADLLAHGYKVAFPFGEDWDYDLILCRREEPRARSSQVHPIRWARDRDPLPVPVANERQGARDKAVHVGHGGLDRSV